jgi:RNA polymerase sigma-70 factor (ECF subfamily)
MAVMTLELELPVGRCSPQMRAGASAQVLEPEAPLIAECRRGVPAAWERLFHDYERQVYGLAYHLCRDQALAADLTQEVFLKLLTRLDQFRSDARFTTWLYRIVLNTYLDHRRGARVSLSLEDPAIAGRLAQPAEQEALVERADRDTTVHAALSRLSPKLRLPLILRYLSGLSYDEIGAVLGLSTGTVASRLSRGLLALERRLRAAAIRPEG